MKTNYFQKDIKIINKLKYLPKHIIILAVILSLIGCMNNTVTSEEAKAILGEIIPEAIEIYGIFYSGLITEAESLESLQLPVEDEGEKFYLVIDDDYKTLQDIKNATEKVFTAEFAENSFYTAFDNPTDEDLSKPVYKDINGQLYKNINFGGKGWGTGWILDSLEIKEQNGDTLVLEIETTLFDEPDGKLTIVLKKTEDKWLLNSHII